MFSCLQVSPLTLRNTHTADERTKCQCVLDSERQYEPVVLDAEPGDHSLGMSFVVCAGTQTRRRRVIFCRLNHAFAER